MAQRIYALGEPIGEDEHRPLPILALLMVGTVLWLLLYGALGWRLWQNGAVRIDAISLALLVATVLLGAAVVLSWRMAWPDLRVNPEQRKWRALSLAKMLKLSPSEFEEYVAQRMGLKPEPVSTQVIPRDRHAMYFATLGVIASSIERLAQRLFARQGFAVTNTPDVKDGGIDVLITDRYGQRGVVQCKRYSKTVGEPVVRDLFGTMLHDGADHAYLVTTASISPAAVKWAMDKPITLIDGASLEKLVK